MAIPKHIIPALKNLVQDLISGDYSRLESDGRAGRLTAAELREAMESNNHAFIDVPDEEFDAKEAIRVDLPGEVWAVDLDMWTEEEGRSDLTLSVRVQVYKDRVIPQINDLHVM